jgi:hypothetical protein
MDRVTRDPTLQLFQGAAKVLLDPPVDELERAVRRQDYDEPRYVIQDLPGFCYPLHDASL